MEGGNLVEAYSHKLLELLPLHAGSELALLVCVEAITMSFVSFGTCWRDGDAFFLLLMAIEVRHTRPLCVIES